MKNKVKIRRYRGLIKFSEKTEIPLIILGFSWLILLIVELIWKLTPFLQRIVLLIWIVFIIDFLLKVFLAPDRWLFLRKNLLTIVSLFIPAFRIFRVFASLRLFRSIGVIRSIRVIRVISSINRGMASLGRALDRRAFGYVLLLTLMVCFAGAASMFAFEKETGVLKNYWDALWWTGMLVLTIGSEYWPKTTEGKIVTFLIGLYSLGVLGYLTAMLASFFIGQDASNIKGEIAGSKQIKDLATEIKLLREELNSLRNADEKE